MNFSASYLKNLKNNLSWDILSYFINFPSAKGHSTKQCYSKKCDLCKVITVYHLFTISFWLWQLTLNPQNSMCPKAPISVIYLDSLFPSEMLKYSK